MTLILAGLHPLGCPRSLVMFEFGYQVAFMYLCHLVVQMANINMRPSDMSNASEFFVKCSKSKQRSRFSQCAANRRRVEHTPKLTLQQNSTKLQGKGPRKQCDTVQKAGAYPHLRSVAP